MPARIPTNTLLADVRRVASTVGHAPTTTEHDEHGKYAYQTLVNRFGEWSEVLTEAGLDPSTRPDRTGKISADQLADDIRRVAEEMDRPPTAAEYNERGQYSRGTAHSRFGGWNAALRAADLDPDGVERDPGGSAPIPDGELLDDLRRVAGIVGAPPTTDQYDEHGRHVHTTLVGHFGGGWNGVLMEAGFDPRDKQTAHTAASTTDGDTVVCCPYCGFTFGSQTSPGNTIICRHTDCQRRFTWRLGLIASASGHAGVRALADGPAFSDELPYTPASGAPWPIPKEYLLRLPHPDGSDGGRTIHYLPGDERAAVRRFLERYPDYVRDCLTSKRVKDALEKTWPPEEYDMLEEQFLWTDHAAALDGDGRTGTHDGAQDAQDGAVGGDA